MSFAQAQARAMDVIYKTYGEDATYTAHGRDAAPARLIPVDELAEFPAGGYETTFKYAKNLYVVRKSEVERVTDEKDYVQLDGVNYVVAESDHRNRTEWFITLRQCV